MHSLRPTSSVKFSGQSRNRDFVVFVYFRAIHFRAHTLGERMLYVWESDFDDDDQ
jgi:hypothetical protein